MDTIDESSVIERLSKAVELAESSFLDELPIAEDRPLNESDLANYRRKSEENLLKLNSLVKNSKQSFSELFSAKKDKLSKKKSSLIVSCLILCGQHSQSELWTTETTLRLSQPLLDNLLAILNFTSLTELLCSNNYEQLKLILEKLRPNLLSSTWKKNPGAVASYVWLIKKIESPHLDENLNIVLPTALIINDDFVVKNKCTGLNCLDHILKNVTATRLSWYGQDEVIYKALEPSLYQKEHELIPPLFSCLISLLEKMHPQKVHSIIEWNHYDDVLDVLLTHMYVEQKLKLREAYILVLPQFLDSMGLSSIRFLVRLLDIFDEYLLEPTSSLLALEALSTLLRVTWPRVGEYSHRLQTTLMKLLVDATSPQSRHKPEIVQVLSENLLTLARITTSDQLIDCSQISVNPQFDSVLKQIINQCAG